MNTIKVALTYLWKLARNKNTWKVMLLILSWIGIGWFFSNYYLQSPIKRLEFQWIWDRRYKTPVKAEKRQEQPIKHQILSPTPNLRSEREIVFSHKHADVLWRVYQLESQRGLADYCRLNGKGYGGFGVLDNKSNIVCYPSFEVAVDRAEYWLVYNGIEKDLVNGLCSYNLGALSQGVKHVNCMYYQNYLAVN